MTSFCAQVTAEQCEEWGQRRGTCGRVNKPCILCFVHTEQNQHGQWCQLLSHRETMGKTGVQWAIPPFSTSSGQNGMLMTMKLWRAANVVNVQILEILCVMREQNECLSCLQLRFQINIDLFVIKLWCWSKLFLLTNAESAVVWNAQLLF